MKFMDLLFLTFFFGYEVLMKAYEVTSIQGHTIFNFNVKFIVFPHQKLKPDFSLKTINS